MNFVRSAIAPDTIVAAVPQKTVWKIRNTPMGSSRNIPSPSASPIGLKNPEVPIQAPSPPYMTANPIRKKQMEPMTKSIRFFIRIFPAFLALVNPVSSMAKPACMKKIRIVPTMVHTTFNSICKFSISHSSSQLPASYRASSPRSPVRILTASSTS